MPKWIGGTEAEGGGLDKAMLATMRSLRVGQKVEVKWVTQDRPRAVEIMVLDAASKPADDAGGTFTGTLIEKGDGWVMVKADSGDSQRFTIPADLPTDSFKVGQKVTVGWKTQQQKRMAMSIKPAGAGSSGETASSGEAEAAKNVITGKITEKGDNFIVVQPADGAAMKLMPRWVGGAPSAGGGLDKAMLTTLSTLNVGDSVTVKWTDADGARIVELKVN